MKAVISHISLYFKRTDRILWLLCIALSALSVVLLIGILDTGYEAYLGISRRNIFIQGLSVLIGAVCAVVISLFDYKTLAKLWKLYLPVCYALMALTFFIGVGTPERPDDKRWLLVPGTSTTLQPAELLRIAFILAFAYHIFLIREHISHPLYLGSLLLHGSVPVIFTHFQGDDGSALIFAAIIICMLFGAGVNWKYIAGALVALCASLPVLWNFILNDFQKERMLALYGQASTDIQGVLYQQHWALISFAMGGAGGKGIFGVSHTYVPVMHNDFIFSFLGECAGLVGCILVIAVMAVSWFKVLACAGGAKDILGQMICLGVFAMLSFQTIINIGMNLSLLPVIGNTLPFLSYGGSSMLTSYLGIGLVLSVYMHSDKSMFD